MMMMCSFFRPPNRSIDSDYFQQYIRSRIVLRVAGGSTPPAPHPLTLMMGPKVIYITRYNTELARLFIFRHEY